MRGLLCMLSFPAFVKSKFYLNVLTGIRDERTAWAVTSSGIKHKKDKQCSFWANCHEKFIVKMLEGSCKNQTSFLPWRTRWRTPYKQEGAFHSESGGPALNLLLSLLLLFHPTCSNRLRALSVPERRDKNTPAKCRHPHRHRAYSHLRMQTGGQHQMKHLPGCSQLPVQSCMRVCVCVCVCGGGVSTFVLRQCEALSVAILRLFSSQ